MQTNNKLFIGGIHIEGNGVRIFKPQKIDNFLKEGLVAVNGKSGAGKTSLLEVIKLAVQGKDALRDMNIMTDGAEEVDIRVPIADFKNPDSRFFIRAVAKATGEVRYTFQVDNNGKFRNTETPLQGMDKLTVSKLQNMMNTSLTYGIENFLSEDYLQVKKFIYETFGEELTKLGLIVAKDSPDYAESINGRIDAAIAERDEITRRQSKLGAYMVNLEGKTRPKFIDISQMEAREKELNQELANLKAKHEVKIDSKEQRIKNVMAEAENVKTKADIVKRDLTDFNNELNREEFLKVANLKKQMEDMMNSRSHWIGLDRTYLLTENCREHVMAIEKHMDEVQENLDNAINNRPAIVLAPIDNSPFPKELDGTKAEELHKELVDLRNKYAELAQSLEAIKAEEAEELDTKEIDAKFEQLKADMEIARENNELLAKFETFDEHQAADQKVKDLYLERNRLFMQINCGVKGLSILLLDDEGKRLGFFYNGQDDKDYFHNENLEPRPLTSYSKSQKIYIAAMLQCYLMSKKAFPLNVLCVDDTGMDNKVRELWDKFAKKFGLMILVTVTNDRTLSDLSPNEILIEDGEILVKEE